MKVVASRSTAAVSFVSTRGSAPAVSLRTALFTGLASDGGLYMPGLTERWTPDEIAALPRWSQAEIAARVLRPFTCGELDDATLASLVSQALNFPIPLVEVEPGVHALELFHGPTLAFKDVGARSMARLMGVLHDGGKPLTVLVATSGDTGSAVGHAFHGVPHTRVVILYPDGRVSPTQEAQLTMFNDGTSNVHAYALAGSFDDCQRLVKAAFADPVVSRHVRLTSANSINIGRLLPQMIYYFLAIAQLGARRAPMVSTPSGNFGNLTAGLMSKRAGLTIAGFVAATNVNDVVPEYLMTGKFEARPSIHTIANAMDVGNPSNFDRMRWLYADDVHAMRRDIVGSRHDDTQVKETIRQVYERHGYLLDPHSAIAYRGVQPFRSHGDVIFLATAHPAKFAEIVEPIIGRAIEMPAPLVQALAASTHITRIDAAPDTLRQILVE